jgi:hypothetical protein
MAEPKAARQALKPQESWAISDDLALRTRDRKGLPHPRANVV